MSTHRVDVVEVKMEKHPNADTLSIVKVAGYTALVRTTDWKDGQLGAYIEPDYVVPENRLEFAFLSTSHKLIENSGVKGYRIRVKRLRGIMSMGLLIPAPVGSKVGDNVIEQLGVVRYEPPIPMSTGGEATKPPPGVRYSYDVESAYRYAHLFEAGEIVVATEKVHGASARYTYIPEVGMFCGSRTEWKKQDEKNLWWKALAAHPEIEQFCREHPELTVYCEAYGIQDLKYGLNNGEVRLVCFDILDKGRWLDHDEGRSIGGNLTWVPIIYKGPWNKEILFNLAEGDSLLSKNKQIREGIVIKPIKERSNLEISRTQLKIVSNTYLERHG